MQHILQEIEDDKEFQEAKDAHQKKVFEQWLKDRNLEEKQTGPQVREDRRDGLQKPNSKQSEDTGRGSAGIEEKSPTPTSVSSWKRGTLSSGLSGDMYHDDDRVEFQQRASDVTTSKPAPKSPEYVNPSPWIKYSKLGEKEYMPVLKDFYPRDEYTMMPKIKSAPKYFTGKFERILTQSDIEDSITPLATKKLRRPDLPKSVIQKELSEDPSRLERPIVFKPKCIYDIITKRKYDPDVIPLSEAPIHLSDDLRSLLIQNCVKFPLDIFEGSSGSGSPDLDAFPREVVANTIRQMSKPDHFPNIRGPEYDLSCRDGVF